MGLRVDGSITGVNPVGDNVFELRGNPSSAEAGNALANSSTLVRIESGSGIEDVSETLKEKTIRLCTGCVLTVSSYVLDILSMGLEHLPETHIFGQLYPDWVGVEECSLIFDIYAKELFWGQGSEQWIDAILQYEAFLRFLRDNDPSMQNPLIGDSD